MLNKILHFMGDVYIKRLEIPSEVQLCLFFYLHPFCVRLYSVALPCTVDGVKGIMTIACFRVM